MNLSISQILQTKLLQLLISRQVYSSPKYGGRWSRWRGRRWKARRKEGMSFHRRGCKGMYREEELPIVMKGFVPTEIREWMNQTDDRGPQRNLWEKEGRGLLQEPWGPDGEALGNSAICFYPDTFLPEQDKGSPGEKEIAQRKAGIPIPKPGNGLSIP